MSTNSYLTRIKELNSDYQKKTESKKKEVPKDAGSILYKYASKIVNNRVLDLYLKALGITTLTPTTLVPVALVMGATTFSDTVSDILGLEKRATKSKSKRSRSRSRSRSKKDEMHIPILDDSVFGTYTKYAGAAVQLALSPFTLIPVGLAVALYEIFNYSTDQEGKGSSWIISQNSGGPINSANIWANYLSSKMSVFGREMTPLETQAITGYPFQQQPNTLLTISPLPEPMGGLGTGGYAAVGGRRRSRSRRRSKSKSRVSPLYTGRGRRGRGRSRNSSVTAQKRG